MLAKLRTFSLLGIEALPVEVEVDVSPGALPKTVLVGLPEAAVKESTHRVERAIVNSGYTRPLDRIVINLAPAELPKQAASFDLPITLGVLAGSGQIASEKFDEFAVVGELSLEGRTRPVKGALSMAIAAAREKGLKGLVVPTESAPEAAVVEDIVVIPVSSLSQAVAFFTGELEIEPAPSRLNELFDTFSKYDEDFADVRGQEMAKRAITLAAAGAHNLLMLGPPGSGKTMLAKRLPTILPPLTPTESIETTRIYSALGRLQPGQPLMARRPFRSPHHTISDAGLVGGGSTPTPGEISLGIMACCSSTSCRSSIAARSRSCVSRWKTTTSPFRERSPAPPFPPTSCSWRRSTRAHADTATTRAAGANALLPQVEKYMAKISGPLLDRIDMHIEVPAVPFKELAGEALGTSSAAMREQVVAAREIQKRRFPGARSKYNAQMSSREIRKHCKLDEHSMNLLRNSVTEMGLSARAHDKILRVARTIADLDSSEQIAAEHLHEAINYRMLDRQMWT